MGKGSERVAASIGDSENNGVSSCEAHHVSRCPQEDCSVSAGKVGEVEVRKEGGLEAGQSIYTLTDTHESPTVDRPAPLRVCGDLPDLLSLFVASGRRDHQRCWRLVLAGEGLSCAGAFNGVKWRMRSAQMRWLTSYNNVLTLGVSQQGFYLASMFLFRFMHPPLLVPWSEIKVRRKTGWVFEYVIFTKVPSSEGKSTQRN